MQSGNNISSSLEHWARVSGGRIAVRYNSGRFTYGQFWQAITSTAAVFRKLAIMPRDRVAIFIENRPESLIAALAAAAVGAVFVPINHMLRTRQVMHILSHSGAACLVSSASRLQTLAPALGGAADIRLIAIDPLPENPGLEIACLADERAAASGEGGELAATIDDDPAAIFYTSGSTGLPKGVLVSHRSLVQGAFAVASFLEIACSDRLLCALPLSFDAGFNQAMTALVSGGTAVLYNYMRAVDLVRHCDVMEITGMTGVPPLWIDLSTVAWPESARMRLRYFANTGGRMPETTLQRLRSLLPAAKPYLMYGFTEAFRSTYLHPSRVDEKPGSVGKALPNARVTVRRPDGTLCDAGEVGELVHVGACAALGYWNDPEATAKRFRSNEIEYGGLRRRETAVWSGDLAYQDKDGFLYFVGRKDAMIKTNGIRVSPTEIEEVALGSGAVREAVAVGVPDSRNGQVVGLVVTASGQSNSTSLEDLLIQQCRAVLPAYMIPARIRVVPEIPRSPNGKFDRNWCLDLLVRGRTEELTA